VIETEFGVLHRTVSGVFPLLGGQRETIDVSGNHPPVGVVIVRGSAGRSRLGRGNGARRGSPFGEVWVSGLFSIITSIIVTLGSIYVATMSSAAEDRSPPRPPRGCAARCAFPAPCEPGRHHPEGPLWDREGDQGAGSRRPSGPGDTGDLGDAGGAGETEPPRGGGRPGGTGGPVATAGPGGTQDTATQSTATQSTATRSGGTPQDSWHGGDRYRTGGPSSLGGAGTQAAGLTAMLPAC
jgi:hypothetical protein